MPLFDSLYNFAGWLAGNSSEAEDLVQETYLKALKGFPSFQPGTNFRAWIFRILRNTFLTSRTGLQATRTVPLDDKNDDEHDGEGATTLAITSETPESILLGRAGGQAIQSALEISETISIPIGTVMSRLSRARRAMRQALQESPQQGSKQGVSNRGVTNG